MTKGLTNDSANQVSVNRSTQVLFGDRESEPGVRQLVRMRAPGEETSASTGAAPV